MTEAHSPGKDQDHRPRKIELSLVVKYEPDEFLDENGNVDEAQMEQKALEYANEQAAPDGAFNVKTTPIDRIE